MLWIGAIFLLNNGHPMLLAIVLLAMSAREAISCTSTSPKPYEIPPNSQIVSCTTLDNGNAVCNVTCNAGYQQQGGGLFVCLYNTWYSSDLFACLGWC